jgi:phosphoglycolate phosphatase-like HAD superfamily hydrolase
MEANEQAGDPFESSIPDAKPNMTAAGRDGTVPEKDTEEVEVTDADRVAEIEAIQDTVRPTTEEMEAAQNVLDEFEAEKAAEAEAEQAPENISLDDVRAIVRETAQAVEDAEFNLEQARKAYGIASLLAVEFSVKPTLAELNRSQVKVTATENRRKARAMKALGELGFGNPKRKPHPPLF